MNKLSAIFLAAAALISASCSTTRVLGDGEYRLAGNSIKVLNDKRFGTHQLERYYQQPANNSFLFGWSPGLSIYNWQNGKGKGWDKFVTKIGTAPVIYNPDAVSSSEESIRNHLKYIGYYDSKVEGVVSVKKRRVYVNYNVELGRRYVIDSLDWDVPEGEFGDCFALDTANISVRRGDMLSESALEAETVRSSKYFRDNGFYGFNKTYYSFVADTLGKHDSVSLHMSIRDYPRTASPEEGKPLKKYTIGKVSITRPKSLKIREKILTGLNTIRPGDTFSESEVTRTYERLSALKVFNSVNVNLSERGENLVDCEISLTSSRQQGFKVNLEASTNSSGLFGISPQISYYHKNIFHGGEWLNLGFMGNFQFKFKDKVRSNEFGVSAGLSLPRFLGLPYRYFQSSIPRTDFNCSYNYQNRPEYRRDIISASFGYTGSYRQRFSYKFYPLQLNIVHLSNLDEGFYNSIKNDPFLNNSYRDHFDFGSGAILYYTTNSDPNPQESFFYSKFQFDIAGNLLSAFRPLMKKDENGSGKIWGTPFSQFVRMEGTVGQTWRFGRNDGQAIAVRLLAGAGFAYGNSSVLPFEKHFYAGGANSLRGWQARSVGPGLATKDTTFVIPNQTGDLKMEANIEYRFDLFWKIEGAAFIDAGNVWTMKTNKGNDPESSSVFTWKDFGRSIAMNWGVGVRADFGFLVLRVDWGMKIHDPARDRRWVNPSQWIRRDGCAVHFGVGYPF